MEIPDSYKEAADWFAEGKPSYEQLRDILLELPFPDKVRGSRNVIELYTLADVPRPPNSIRWIGDLLNIGVIDDDQLIDLCFAAQGPEQYASKTARPGVEYPVDEAAPGSDTRDEAIDQER